VVSIPLKNMKVSDDIPNIWKVTKNVPNHQPNHITKIYIEEGLGLSKTYGSWNLQIHLIDSSVPEAPNNTWQLR
jgi:hypothetical protein